MHQPHLKKPLCVCKTVSMRVRKRDFYTALQKPKALLVEHRCQGKQLETKS